ncbi:MAG: hypothetical protein A2937_00695 [Candidatus Yonathbacteria bacterium RIFCSPLOWO2_01_FULL_47_33b]|uniref:Uncharacterized protein n=1 Tax=Candidatus Yonathbacteria bacterium RIFCSPLOWO2_01_FULL_47_33b TaxID=1802727 RepID=A0A1G2SED8_9BACT|nr:MAG: hypothetical protein A2937_00695 [Candidatus Yonathbacteria bacterium RIFCSPLOWO2_01_FULL_47_33b]
MSFEGFTPKQEKGADEILTGSPLEGVGFDDAGFTNERKIVMESVGGEYNPYAKKEATGLYPEGERGERIISSEESEEAAKRLKGSEAEKWELI